MARQVTIELTETQLAILLTALDNYETDVYMARTDDEKVRVSVAVEHRQYRLPKAHELRALRRKLLAGWRLLRERGK